MAETRDVPNSFAEKMRESRPVKCKCLKCGKTYWRDSTYTEWNSDRLWYREHVRNELEKGESCQLEVPKPHNVNLRMHLISQRI